MLQKLSLFTIAFCALHLVRCDLVTDAEAALLSLRQVINVTLNDAYIKHIGLSSEIDQIAAITKSSGSSAIEQASIKVLQTCRTSSQGFISKATNQLDECVNKEATEAIDFLFSALLNATKTVLQISFEEEKAIIACDAEDEACLNAVIASIQTDGDLIEATLNTAVDSDQREITVRINDILACASQSKILAFKTYISCALGVQFV